MLERYTQAHIQKHIRLVFFFFLLSCQQYTRAKEKRCEKKELNASRHSASQAPLCRFRAAMCALKISPLSRSPFFLLFVLATCFFFFSPPPQSHDKHASKGRKMTTSWFLCFYCCPTNARTKGFSKWALGSDGMWTRMASVPRWQGDSCSSSISVLYSVLNIAFFLLVFFC